MMSGTEQLRNALARLNTAVVARMSADEPSPEERIELLQASRHAEEVLKAAGGVDVPETDFANPAPDHAATRGEPASLWLQWHGDGDPEDTAPVDEHEVTWSREKVFPGDLEYVLASPLRELVTMEHESKEAFIQRVRAVLRAG